MNRIFGTTVTNVFSILGAVATMFSTYIVAIAFFANSEDQDTVGIQRVQATAAKLIAPSDFIVQPAQLAKAANGADFSLTPNQVILVSDKEIPMMIDAGRNAGENTIWLKVNNRRWQMSLGDVRELTNDGCKLLLYKIEKDRSFFKQDCT